MAFNLSTRFSAPPKSHQLLDPGSYQNTNSLVIKPNKIPFLSKTPRNTQPNIRLWTQAIYNGDLKPKIPKCTTISSKVPRFTYETVEEENEPPVICQCGQKNTCECPIEKVKANIQDEQICHATVRRRLYKGRAPHSEVNKGKEFSTDKILSNVSKQTKVDCPPFYNATVVESNAFYRGCKWSRWTSNRNSITISSSRIPGPADYNINGTQPRYEFICAEKFRALRRQTSKQLRFIEKVQRQNILQNFPGPASYTPILPKGSKLQCIGPKAERFCVSMYDDTPKPTTYFIKRDFDINKTHFSPCCAKLPSRAPFSVNAPRFRYQYEIGPSPNSYNVNKMTRQLKHCNTAPFGSLSKRFTDNCKNDTLNFGNDNIEFPAKKPYETNQLPTWEFRSKTIRMKPLAKILNEPGPADLYLSKSYIRKRSLHLQCICPFFTSEARFLNWFNWISVHGIDKTPGPASYNLEKIKCLHAVKIGPLNRSERFPYRDSQTPAPNTYEIKTGLFDILSTNNQKLKNNINNNHQFVRKQPVQKKILSLDEQELMLLNKSIALLDVPDIFKYSKSKNKITAPQLVADKTTKPKLLRSFLYSTKVKKFY